MIIFIFAFRHSQAQSSPKEYDVFTGYPNKVAGCLHFEVTVYLYFRLIQVGSEVCLWLLGPAIEHGTVSDVLKSWRQKPSSLKNLVQQRDREVQ